MPQYLNTNQILQGARTVGGSKTYSSVIATIPLTSVAAATYTVAVGDTAANALINLTGGELEVEGKAFSVGSGAAAPGSFNLYNVSSLLTAGKKYRLEAVPSYNVFNSQVAATSAGLNYFATNDNAGNAILQLFIKQSTIDAVNAQGGLVALEQLVYSGSATKTQTDIYTEYKTAQDNYLDLRYNSASPLPIAGYNFVISEVETKTAAGGQNVLTGMSQQEVLDLLATVEFVYTVNVTYSGGTTTATPAAAAAYGATPWLVNPAQSFGYANSTDQTNDANRIPIDVEGGTFAKQSDASSVGYITLAVYSEPGYLPRAQQASSSVGIRYLTNKESLYFGYIDPIYLANQNDGPKFSRAKLSRLTNWADTQPLVEFVATAGTTSTSTTPYIQATSLVKLA